MPLENLLIARHGFRQNWISETWSSPTGMKRDPPLAVYGLEQADRLGAHLSNPPSDIPKPELVFSSGFYRCIQTSLPLAKALGVEINVELGIGEWYSPVPSTPPHLLHPRPHPPSTLAQYFPPNSLNTAYVPTMYPSRKGETLAELLQRAETFLAAFIPRVEATWPEVRTVILVGHAASVIALGRALTADPTLEVTAGCASYSHYARTPPGSAGQLGDWAIVRNGEAGHLEKGVERNWSFRDVVLTADGDIIEDPGDAGTENERDEPVGLSAGMEKYVQGRTKSAL